MKQPRTSAMPSPTGIVPDDSQRAAIDATGHRLIIGVPGSGKTSVLVAITESLLGQGIPASDIALTTFAYRSTEVLRNLAHQQSSITHSLTFQQIKDWILPILSVAGQSVTEATNNDVRRLLRALVVQQGFTGTLDDAEHVIRSAKSRAKRLPEADINYPFFTAYNALLKARGLSDRHDIVRQHAMGLRDHSLPPLPVKYLLVDNLQDATDLQMLWLKYHAAAGITVIAAGHDDQTAFGLDGALGETALTGMQTWPDVRRYILNRHYRLPQPMLDAATKVTRYVSSRTGLGEDAQAVNKTVPQFNIQGFTNETEEQRWLVAQALTHAGQGRSVGVLTQDDFSASILVHMLRKRGLNPASYARLIWDEPVPQTVLALVAVLIGAATPGQLIQVLAGFGVPPDLLTMWLVPGPDGQPALQAGNWLASGCPLPPLKDASPTVEARLSRIRQIFQQALQGFSRNLTDPRTVFLATLHELLAVLPDHEDPQALLAADMLLSLNGPLHELLPRVTQETLPDMQAPVTVAPLREVRNMEFDVVLLSLPGSEKQTRTSVPTVTDHARRCFYLGCTRTRGQLVMTHTGTVSSFASEYQQALRMAEKRSGQV